MASLLARESSYNLLMIAFLTLELRIEAAHSLKDKRQVTRSLKDRLRSSFNVAVAELEPSPALESGDDRSGQRLPLARLP